MESVRGIIGKSRVNESLPQPQEQNRFTLVTPDTPVLATSVRFFDQEAAAGETQELTTELVVAYEKAGGGIIMDSVRDAKRFNDLKDKVDNCAAIGSVHSDKFMDVDATGGGIDHLTLSVLHITAMGTSVVVHNSLEEQMQIAKRQDFTERFQDFAQLYGFSATSELGIKIGGISLLDFLNFRVRQDSPVPYFNYLVNGAVINTNGLNQQILAENQTPLNIKYPNIALSTIETLPHKIGALMHLLPRAFESSAGAPPLLNEITQQGRRLVEGVSAVTGATRELIVNPRSPHFPGLRDQVVTYLTHDLATRLVAINTITSGRGDHLFELYRKAKPLVGGNIDIPFFQLVTDVIREYVEEGSRVVTILTKDDVVGVLDTDEATISEGFQPSILEQLSKQIGQVLSKAPNRKNYGIDPDNIEWENLVKPDSVTLEFDSGRPKRFTIVLSFDNELGEAVDLRFTVDTQRNKFDWVLLEDPMEPEDQEVASLRSALIKSSVSIIKNAQVQADEEFNSRQKSKAQTANQLQPSVQKAGRERNDDPVYQLRKKIREEQKTQPGVEAIPFDIEPATVGVRNQIAIANTQGLDDNLRHLSQVDREIVRMALTEYNERGTGGKFTRKKKLGLDGTPRYTLSIGCTVPKGARVLLREQTAVNGARTFEIVDIRYRKDIYRLNDL